MSLPAELDFQKEREATPERMNRATGYLLARIRALEAIQPEFQSEIERLRAVGLVKVAEGLVPVLDAARAIEATLQDLRDQWTGDLLPLEVAQNAANAVAALLADYRARWLGAHAEPPAVDEFGDPVTVGAMYWDTTLNAMRVRGSDDWQDVSSIATDAAAAVAARDVAIAKAAQAAASADAAIAAAATAAADVVAVVAAARDEAVAARDVTIAARDVTTAARDDAVAAKTAAQGFAASIDPAAFAAAEHTHDVGDITGLTNGVPELRRLGALARYFPHDAANTVGSNGFIVTPNQIYFVPFSTPGTYDAICFSLSSAAGNGRVAIFGADVDGFPGDVIEQSPQFALSAVGDKICLLAAPRTLAHGERWWLAINCSAAPTIPSQTMGPRGYRMFGSHSLGSPGGVSPSFPQAFGPFVDLTPQPPASFSFASGCLMLSLRSA